jgi:hypothetical protein
LERRSFGGRKLDEVIGEVELEEEREVEEQILRGVEAPLEMEADKGISEAQARMPAEPLPAH